jgi:hypothetical protein
VRFRDREALHCTRENASGAAGTPTFADVPEPPGIPEEFDLMVAGQAAGHLAEDKSAWRCVRGRILIKPQGWSARIR